MAASESHLNSEHGQTSQQKQPIESREWRITVEDHSDVNPLRKSSDVCIFRVPNILITDTIKREAYVPKRVPLGPYHHSSPELRPMEGLKARALHRMTTRFNNMRHLVVKDHLTDFVSCAADEIVKVEKEMRDSYEKKINYNEKA